MNSAAVGTLYVVATPIGNLSDLTERARQTLTAVDLVAAEDTRRTGLLLHHLGISVPMLSFHQHSRPEKLAELVARLQEGQNIAVVTDAGTPGIADPAASLVAAASAVGVTVVPIPGASAGATLLSASGLSADQYIFVGFLPKKKGRQTELKKLVAVAHELPWPQVYFESPGRMLRTVADLSQCFAPSSPLVIGRELTKKFEEIWRGPLSAAAAWLPGKKGEFVFALVPVLPSASRD